MDCHSNASVRLLRFLLSRRLINHYHRLRLYQHGLRPISFCCIMILNGETRGSHVIQLACASWGSRCHHLSDDIIRIVVSNYCFCVWFNDHSHRSARNSCWITTSRDRSGPERIQSGKTALGKFKH